MPDSWTITRGRLLAGNMFTSSALAWQEGIIGAKGTAPSAGYDASGLLVLPGIIDVHGDAFERQLMPRPGVMFPANMALKETGRQLAANGITTAFFGLTRSWEPGLRSCASAHDILTALERLRPTLPTDVRVHLRHETYCLENEDELLAWIHARRIGVLAFNDHMSQVIGSLATKPDKLSAMAERSGVSSGQFAALARQVADRVAEVPASIRRLAAAARKAGVPMMSHDDRSAQERRDYRALGISICEFPTTLEAAREAIEHNEPTIFGAPNVVRGGSHTGSPCAEDMVRAGFATILASDYYYPALLAAPFLLAMNGAAPLPQAWALVSANPARALGLDDRGTLDPGKRADVVLVDPAIPDQPRLVATFANGRLVHNCDAARLLA